MIRPEISKEYPPNFADIVKIFPMAANKGVIFAFNDTIYNPSNINLTPELKAHEAVHLKRQGKTEEEAIAWWDAYMIYPDFRYNEELLAHSAEYQSAIKNANNRKERRSALKYIAKKLSAPLYGRMVTAKQAEKEILDCR